MEKITYVNEPQIAFIEFYFIYIRKAQDQKDGEQRLKQPKQLTRKTQHTLTLIAEPRLRLAPSSTKQSY